ncbi:MAG: YkgJ family cysteine cluster protein [Pyrinomonadaceae bacterium]
MSTTATSYPASYDCSKCPAYCCSIYERVQVTKRDINRLARHFQVDYETALVRYTRTYNTTERVLRRRADPVLGQSCAFLNPVTRQCKIYNARPSVCREFPTTERCAHFDLIEFERTQQNDPDVLPLIQITFRNGNGR